MNYYKTQAKINLGLKKAAKSHLKNLLHENKNLKLKVNDLQEEIEHLKEENEEK